MARGARLNGDRADLRQGLCHVLLKIHRVAGEPELRFRRSLVENWALCALEFGGGSVRMV